MKKLFFFAIAALGMTVACQKEVKVENPDIDDNAPAEIVFGVNAPSITVTKTKAAVEDWTGTPDVYIFSGVVGEKGMDFTTPLIYNAKAQVSGGNTGATVKFAAADGSYTTPAVHYYEVDKTYNFYGYYKGDAVITGDEIKNESNVLTAEVTIDGDDDIMVATTDLTKPPILLNWKRYIALMPHVAMCSLLLHSSTPFQDSNLKQFRGILTTKTLQMLR